MLSLFDRGTGSKDSLQKEQLLKNALTLPCEDKEIKSKVYNNLADCYEAQGKIKEAIVEYHKAIETDPALATSYLSLGDIYRKTGEISEAIKYYEKALLCLTPAGSKEKQKQADIEELKKVLDELKALKADK
jgi:tetratricopeptide (TPR) repeat protein